MLKKNYIGYLGKPICVLILVYIGLYKCDFWSRLTILSLVSLWGILKISRLSQRNRQESINKNKNFNKTYSFLKRDNEKNILCEDKPILTYTRRIDNKSLTNNENELELRNREFEVISKVSKIITSSLDIEVFIKYIYEVFSSFSKCDRYKVCFLQKNSGKLVCEHEYGEQVLGEIGETVEIDKFLRKCVDDKKTVVAIDVLLDKRGIRGDKIIIPLYVFGELTGIVYLETGSINSFSNVDVKFFENIAIYIAVIITNTEMFNSIYIQKQEIESLYQQTTAANKELNSYLNELAKAKEELKIKNSALTKFYNEIQTGYLQTVMALANSIEAKDLYTRGHCQRVMEISCEMAKRMGFSDDEIEDLRYAAILHDIGKIGISASIINKGGRLSDEEYCEIKKHPLIAYNILKEVEFIKKGLNAILEHHERYDGKGYPYGIKADGISKFGRILCVADAFDAMTTDRPYKQGMKMNKAIKEIEKCRGTHFDPVIADIFIEMSKQIISDIDEVSIPAAVQVE